MPQSATVTRVRTAPRFVSASVNYIGEMAQRPCYYANDHSRDVLNLDSREIRIEDARTSAEAPSLTREGCTLVRHVSAVKDFRDPADVAQTYTPEIVELISQLSGADRVVGLGSGTLRFSEQSVDSGRLNNSRPARFIHVDVSDPTAATFAERFRPQDAERVRRFAFYNIWRVISPPPQDVPLAICDARTVASHDLVPADAIFDHASEPEWSFESYVVRYNPLHRWIYFSGMHSEEALVFKTHDSEPGQPSHVPHSAFNDPACPPGVPPRASIEIRAIAYWLG